MSAPASSLSRRRLRRSERRDASRPALPPIAARDPAFLATALVAAACVGIAVTSRIRTSDVWQHLLVGKALWQLGHVPQENLWTWPSFGTRDLLPSWGFTVLLWPFWLAGGAWGMQAWRWITTLGAFALGLATARKLGARGVTPLFVIAIAALSYRARGQVQPETLVAVLLALQIGVLERRRARGGGALALVAIAWSWANVHASYCLGLALTGIHLFAPTPSPPPRADLESAPGSGAANPSPSRAASSTARAIAWLERVDRSPLPIVLAAAIAISFANPFGWRALWQPFDYFLYRRHEAFYQSIPELAPLFRLWPSTLTSGLPFLVVAWPLLAFGRAFVLRFDPIEGLTCVLFVGLTLFDQRFSGSLAIAIVPYLARDLSELAGAMRWPARLSSPSARAAAATVAMLAASAWSWTDPRDALGIGFVDTAYPGPACDFIERQGIRGRMFNPCEFSGYILWRFWPERDRLPFLDIHPSGERRDRDLYTWCFASPEAWNELMRRHSFDVVLLDGRQDRVASNGLLDRLDADRDWALVFRDDASAIYLRRNGSMGALTDSLAYHVMPGGPEKFFAMGDVVARDSTLRLQLRRELERRLAESPLDATAHSHLANLDFIDNDRVGARRHLDAALAVDPRLYSAHRRIGYLWLAEGAWERAIDEFEKERAIGGPPVDEYMRIADCWEKLGNRGRAADAYRKELAVHSDNDEARAALERLSGK